MHGLQTYYQQLPRDTFWSWSELEKTLGKETVDLWYAKDGQDKWLGFLIAERVPGAAELYFIHVADSARKQGLGRKLLQQFMTAMDSYQVSRLFLEVRRSNEAAQRLYLSCGFQQIGERLRYYADGEDALIYERAPTHANARETT